MAPPDLPQNGGARVAILERNRVVAQRLARVLACATGMPDVAVEDDPASLRSALCPDPLLLACDGSDAELALEWASSRYPSLRVIAWTNGPADRLIELALAHPRLCSVVAWPSFASMPRAWEIALAARRVIEPYGQPPRLADLVRWGGSIYKWRPSSSADRDQIVADVLGVAQTAGASPRIAERLSEVAHEMLMNAMYDAPVDEEGRVRYGHDRRQALELDPREVPTLRMAVDGVYIGLQIVDPFGRLRRGSVLSSVHRGLGASQGGGAARAVLDTSSGGAGLGMFKIYSGGAAMIVDVEPSQYTMVTSIFDLDVSPRELRSMPSSLHIFDRGEAGLLPPRPLSRRPS